MRKIKLLQINWYKLLTVAFLVSLFVVSSVEAAYTQKENTDTNIVKNTLNTYKEIFSQAQLKSSSLAAVGSSLTSISDSLAEGWISFSKIILNNFIEKANDTKDFVSSVFDEMSFIQEKVVDSFSSNPSTVENKVEKKKDIKQDENKVQVSNSSSSNLLSNLQNSITSKTEIVKEVTSVRGEQGPKGDTGAMGPMGPVGPQGPKGERGSSGRDADTSDFVLSSFFENQIDRLFDSISEDIDSSSDSITEGGTLNDSILNRPVLNNATGTFLGTLTGNADTVTNGLYSTGSYSDPSWLTISKSKVGLANVDNTSDAIKSVFYSATSGNADTVTNGLYSTGSYSNPTWLTAIPYSILSGTIPTWNQDTTGNAATVTNGLYSNGSYSDPLWLTISKSKVGLANVDNTSDADKPISTLTQNALNLKSNLSGATFTGPISATNLSGTNTGDQTLSGLGGVPTSRLLTINGSSFDLSGDRSWTISDITGNAGTVTNGLYSTGSYSDPSWLTISKSKVGLANVDNTSDATKSVLYASTSGNASTVTNGLYSTSSYANPTWLTAIPYSILSGTIPTWNQDTTGNAATVTNGVYTSRTINGKALSSDVTISAGDLGLGNVTNESKATMFTSPTFTGTVGGFTIGGDIIPSLDNTHSLGSSTSVWKDVYVGNGSIYVDGQKVLQTNDDKSVVVSSDVNQNLIMKTSGTGDIEFNPSGTGIIRLKGNLLLSGTKTFETSDNSAVIFADGISSPTITTSVLNGGISITPNGSGNTYITSGYLGIGTTLPRATLDVVGNMVLGNNTLNNSLLSIYSTDDGSYSHGITIVDKEAKYGSWQNPSGLDGITTDDAGTPNGWNTLFLNYYSNKDISFNYGGGNSVFNGNVGVGTMTPEAKLDIKSLATGMGTEDLFKVGLDANWYLKLQQNWNAGGLDYNFIQQAGTGAENNFNVLSLSKGNVGIGTTSPSTKLHIKDSTSALIRLQTAGTGEGGIEWTDTSNSVLGSIKQSSNTGDITTYIGTSPKMTVQYATGNVGIGTASPARLLDVSSTTDSNVAITSAVTGQSSLWFADTDTNIGGVLYTHTNNQMEFRVNDASRMTIDTNGNVGIGTTNPQAGLHISKDVYGPKLILDDTNTANKVPLEFRSNNVPKWELGQRPVAEDNDLVLFRTDDGVNYNNTMTWDHVTGNVGIGTTSPQRALNISTTSSAIPLRLQTDGSNTGIEFIGVATKTNFFIGKQYNADNVFEITPSSAVGGTTFSNPALVITSGSNVGIGTTTPEFKFQAVSDASAVVGEFKNTSTNGYGLRITTYSTGSQYAFAVDSYGGGYSRDFVIKNDGNVGIGTETPSEKLHVAGNILSTNLAGTGNRCVYVTGAGILSAKAEDCGSASGADNMGNHTATQNIQLGNYWLSGDGGNEGVFVGSAGNVGVGTNAPGTNLHIYENNTDVVSALRVENAGTGDASINFLLTGVAGYSMGIDNSDSDKFKISTSTAGVDTGTKFTLQDDGNVGIGTTTPVSKLDVNGAINIADGNNLTWGGAYAANIPTIWGVSGASGYLNFAPSGSTNGVAMTMLNNGNVGIGTTSPEYKLDIQSTSVRPLNIGGAGTETQYMRIINTGGDSIFGVDRSTGGAMGTGTLAYSTAIGTVSNTALHLLTNDITRVTVDNTGNVGIGTTTPEALLTVGGGSTAVAGISRRAVVTSNDNSIQTFQLENLSDGDSAEMRFIAMSHDGSYMAFTQPGQNNTGTTFFGATKSTGSFIFNSVSNGSAARDMYIGSLSDKNFYIGTNNLVRLTVKNDGNVGIGTTSPSSLLTLGSSAPIISVDTTDGADSKYLTLSGGGSGASARGAFITMYGNENSTNPAELRLSTGDISGTGESMTFYADGLEKMRITGAGNVGIGTTTPGAKLTIYDSTVTSGEHLLTMFNGSLGGVAENNIFKMGFDADGSVITGAFMRAANNIPFNIKASNGGNGITLLYTGNVGIGTGSPGKKLDVEVSGSTQDGIRLTTGGLELASFTTTGSTGEIRIGGTSAPAGAFFPVFYANGVERMRLDVSGNVGIGTTNPGAKLHVVGMASAFPANSGTTQTGLSSRLQSNDSNAILDIGLNSASGAWLQATNSTGLNNNYPILLNPNGGNVGIGTTNPEFKLDVNGDIALPRTNKLMFAGPTAGDRLRSYFTGDSNNNVYLYGPVNNIITTFGYSGNVGIGTTNPGAKLEITATASSITDQDTLTLSQAGENGHVLLFNNAFGPLALIRATKKGTGSEANEGVIAFEVSTNSILSEKMRIDNLGNVGIGTITPQSRLSFSSASHIGVATVDSSDNGYLTIGGGGQYDLTRGGSIVLYGNEYGTDVSKGAVRIVLGDGNAGTYKGRFAVESGSSGEMFTVLNSGNVGIGLTSPAAKLHISDGANAAGTYTAINLSKGTAYGETKFDTFYTAGGNYGTTLGETMTVNVGKASVGIGTTAPAGFLHINQPSETSTPSLKLTLGTASNTNIIDIQQLNGGGTGAAGTALIKMDNRGAAPSLYFSNNGSNPVIILNNGNTGIGMSNPSVALDVTGDIEYTGTLTDVSDERLKDQITTITGDQALAIITSMQAKSFIMRDSGKKEYGYIAQEILPIFPDAVSVIDPETGYLGLNYISFIPLATESIKQLNLKVEVLDSDINGITLKEMLSDFFGSVVVNITDGVASIKGLVVETLKVGSPAKRTGITLYDEETGEPYCISVAGGQAKTVPGECGVIDIEKIAEEKAEREAAEQADRDAAAAAEAEAQEALRQQELLNATGGQQQAPAPDEPTPEELVAQEAARLAEIAEAERLAAEQAAAAEAERLAAEQAAQQSAEQQTPPAEESTTPTSDTTNPSTPPAGE